MVSPPLLWNAKDASALTFSATYTGDAKSAKLYLKKFGDKEFREENAYPFDVKSSEKATTYKVQLSENQNYAGAYDAIKILLTTEKELKGGSVFVESVSLKK